MTDMIVIDCAHFSNKEAAHAYLAAALHLPAHYGGTLDALFDCLTELPSGTSIAILNASLAEQNLGEYGRKLLNVFCDAARDNAHLSVSCF